jgi:hypothetical protein
LVAIDLRARAAFAPVRGGRRLKGDLVYLIMAMTPEKLLRMKPQNLLTGLPVKHWETVS